jgi:acyl-coenzyme A synthetase/AMP-(fatty) acid ligase
MLSLVDDGAPPPCPDPFNLAEDVLAAGLAAPDRIALQILRPAGAERWSHARLRAAVLGTGAGLLARGLAPGDRVLMRLGNTADFPVLFLGAIAAGLVPVPTSAQLTVPEVTALAAALRPALVVAAEGLARPAGDWPVATEAELRGWHALPPCDIDRGAPDRLAYMVFTSGTTGRPRAVMHAHRAIRARRMMWDGWYGLTPADRVLHAGAFNWTYTLGTGLMDPWAAGATALIPAAGVTPEALPLLLKRFDATIFAAAPGVYRQLLRGVLPGMPKLRHGLSAGEKLPEATRAAWVQATGTPVYEAFGMSEISTFLSGSPSRPAPAGALGYPQAGRRVAILDPEGRPVPRGTPGTIAVGRDDPGLFLGYLDAPDETAARFAGDWFLTGDMGVMAGDGAIAYLGRGDDMMNAGGYRVSPLEVEAAMAAHPAIEDCAAVEVQVKADASVIALAYVGGPVTAGELASFAAARLARYKQPRLWRRVDALPRGANGKLLRAVLRREIEGQHDPA